MDPKDYARFVRRAVRSLVGKDHMIWPDASPRRIRLGSDYGGWVVARQPLERRQNSVVYSCGLGRDITFDLRISEMFDCEVFGFDPTPLSLRWLSEQKLPPKIRVFPYGVAGYDGKMSMGVPEIPDWDSFSVFLTDGPQAECEVKRIPTLMSMLGHTELDVLKMDIEGSEYSVLDDILANGPKPTQLLVEFHHNLYGIELSRTIDYVARLRTAGYSLINVSLVGREFSFVLTSALA